MARGTSASPQTVANSPPPETASTRRGVAFGLRIAGAFPAPGLWTAAATAARRRVSLGIVPPAALAQWWPDCEGEPLLRLPLGDNGPILALDEHPERGYRLRVDGFGDYLIAGDGQRVLLTPGPVECWRWQRLLTAQVLPIAALAQGLELFHASAVALDGRVLAFAGASGAGKTTLAARVMLADAAFVSDDVLALERVGDEVIAHPGPALMNLRESTEQLLSAHERKRLGVEIGRDKAGPRLLVRREAQALPLHAICLLRRTSSRNDRVRVVRLSAPGPAELLGAGFGTVIRTPARLVRRLDLCAHMARHTTVFALEAPVQAGPEALAEAVLRHAQWSRL
jgi:hypothetical protein